MSEQTDNETILKIKKHLDNGFTGDQTADKCGVSVSLISRVRKDHFGVLPEFEEDLDLKKELSLLNLEKMRMKLSKRKVPKNKKYQDKFKIDL